MVLDNLVEKFTIYGNIIYGILEGGAGRSLRMRGNAMRNILEFRKRTRKGISIRNKIFLSCSILLITTLALTALSFNTASSNISVRTVTQDNQRELALVTNTLNSQLTHIFDYAVSIAADPHVITELRENPELPQSNIQRYTLQKSLNKTVSSIMGLNRDVSMWDLVSADGQFYHAGGYYTLQTMEQSLGHEHFRQASKLLSTSIFGPYLMDIRTDKRVPVFLVIKPVVDLDNHDLLGFVLFIIRESTFASVFENNMPNGSESSFYILDQGGLVVSSSEKTSITQPFSTLGLLSGGELSSLKTAGTLRKRICGVEMLFSIMPDVSNRTHWTVVACQPLNILMSGQRALNRSLLIVGNIACLVALIASFLISRSISRPILRLAHSIQSAAQGDISQTAAWRGGREVRVLYSGFNQLMDTVNSLLRRVYREEKEKSDYQMRLIQEQIKPHFLYNTLEMIKSLIELDMSDTAGQCISSLASFYRLTLSRGNDIISIQDEIRLSEQYMYLQKLRYIEYLDYRFDIPENLGSYQIPKMTLQPLLENAIYHGVKEKQTMGMICVKIRDNGASLTIAVEDNGKGMDTDTLRSLQQSIADSDSPPGNSFGLSSINRRLNLLFKDRYSLTIDSAEGCGTTVILTVPRIQAERQNEERNYEAEGSDRRG